MPEPVDTQVPQVEIKPVPTPKESIERFFRTMPDDAPERDMVFKIRSRTFFYDDFEDSEDKTKTWGGQLIDKQTDEGETDPEYFVIMDPEEFKKIYGTTDKIIVRNIGRAVGFAPMVETLYYHKQNKTDIRRTNIDELIYLFLNPAAVSHVDPEDLPAYDLSLDISTQRVSQG